MCSNQLTHQTQSVEFDLSTKYASRNIVNMHLEILDNPV